MLSLEISQKQKVMAYQQMGSSLELVGLDSEGEVIDIFMEQQSTPRSYSLDDRILRKRPKVRRSWESGNSAEAEWLISDGLR